MSNLKALLLAALGSGSLIGPTFAAPITLVNPPYLILNDIGVNDIGETVGVFITVGDSDVVPNGDGGTTATAQTTELPPGMGTFAVPLPFVGSPAAPNQFENNTIPDNASLLGPWTLNFTNSAGGSVNTASATTGSLVGVTVPPFASNVTVSGSSATPTFTWTYPIGGVNGVTVNIFDKSSPNAAGGAGLVYSASFPGTTNSFTVPSTLANGPLQPNHDYTINFKGLILRNTSLPLNLSTSNTSAWSQAFFDFTPLPAGSPVVNLPSVTPAGAYQYSMTVVAGQTYFVDPTVAVGYSFAIGAGNPNFTSVILPAVQTASFDLSFLYDGTDFSDMVLPETVFDFPTGGVSSFTVTGIDPADGLDPADTTAFITGLTFGSDGTFTGTQTPITALVATPEPGSIALLASGLFGLRLFRRRWHRSLAA